MKPQTIEERFWFRVDRRGPNECWPWLAGHTDRGHGLWTEKRGTVEVASRAALRFSGVRVVKRDFVCHTCDNPPCCNPKHLYVGNRRTNADDVIARGLCRGEKNGNAKLSIVDVRHIRELAAQGYSHRSLAKQFGLSSHWTIGRIVRGIGWKDAA